VNLLNKLLAEFIDYCTLYQLHMKKSRTSHFSNLASPIQIEELFNFYIQPNCQ